MGVAITAPVPAPARPSEVAVSQRPTARWRLVAYAYALVLGCVTSYFLFGIPIQLSDSFSNLLQIQGLPVSQVFVHELRGGGYLRPLLQVQLKIVYDLARGDYFDWYRGIQALQVIGALLLTVRLLRIRTASDAAAVPLCLAILLGIHTFTGTVREAFPINTFLTLVLSCLAAACLAQSRGGRIVEVSSALLLVFSLLTLETGLLVWVVLVAAHLLRYPGTSRRAAITCTAIVAVYLLLRFVVLHVGTPGLTERSSGFGFSTLEPGELVARFGANPLPFYTYNVASAALGLLFAEPRGGVWVFLRDFSQGALQPWHVINVLSSALTTILIVYYVAQRLSAWRRGEISDSDRLVLLFLAILPANAIFCLAYTKDVIMSPAGVFYALAAFAAFRQLIVTFPAALSANRRAATALLIAIVAAGWSVRLVGIHYLLRSTAGTVRTEWAFVDDWQERNKVTIASPDQQQLKQTLYDDAIWRRPEPPHVALGWADRVFDTQ